MLLALGEGHDAAAIVQARVQVAMLLVILVISAARACMGRTSVRTSLRAASAAPALSHPSGVRRGYSRRAPGGRLASMAIPDEEVGQAFGRWALSGFRA